MFLETFNGDSREFQGYLKEVQSVFQVSFKAVSNMLEVSLAFKESAKCVSREFQCFNVVLFCNFLLA